MWEQLRDRLPSWAIILYALLSALVPWIVFKVNRLLHQYGDPPWKREQNGKTESQGDAPGTE